MRTFLFGAIVGAMVMFAGVRAKQRRDAQAADAAVDAEIARLVDALDAHDLCLCGQPAGRSRLQSSDSPRDLGAPAPMDPTLELAHLMTRFALGPRRRANVLPH